MLFAIIHTQVNLGLSYKAIRPTSSIQPGSGLKNPRCLDALFSGTDTQINAASGLYLSTGTGKMDHRVFRTSRAEGCLHPSPGAASVLLETPA